MKKNGSAKRAPPPPKPREKGKLRWLKIHKFRHVEPCELRFSDGFNVLLGLNGTGKTTLLELIAAALKFDFLKMKREAFSIEYEIEIGGGTIVALVRNDGREDRQLQLLPELAAGGRPAGSYKPKVELILSGSGDKTVSVWADETGITIGDGSRTEKNDDFRVDPLKGPELLSHIAAILGDDVRILRTLTLALAEWKNVRRFDEALGYLRAATGKFAGVLAYRGAEASSHSVRGTGPIPDAILRDVERQSRTWDASVAVISVEQEHVPLLSRMASMLGFERVGLLLTHVKTDVAGSSELKYFGELRFRLRRTDGSVISHDLLSYGQKRALAFLYYLAVNEETVIADELVDGLHHLWIADCIEAIGDRQAFLASQNPLLLDFLEFDSAEKVGKSFIQCRLKSDKKGERMIWSNLSEYDADRFFKAYQVGLQHVSEILRTKGLW
jgi:energy-coupling factor transporter ATP-binding protein EcfA2